MAKYKELNKKDKVAFWVGALFTLTFLAFAAWVIWAFCVHLYRHEWLEAELQVALLFLGYFWRKNQINKKKAEKLEAEAESHKATVEKLKEIRKSIILEAYKQGYQNGIDFQRKVLVDWVEQKTGHKI